jgi:hypothetical protein
LNSTEHEQVRQKVKDFLGADDVHAVLESGELLLAKLQQIRSQMERNKKILVK